MPPSAARALHRNGRQGNGRRGNGWTAEEEKILIEGHKNGKTLKETAFLKFEGKRSYGAVCAHWRRAKQGLTGHAELRAYMEAKFPRDDMNVQEVQQVPRAVPVPRAQSRGTSPSSKYFTWDSTEDCWTPLLWITPPSPKAISSV